MTDEHPSFPPSSEDVVLALRHCWQPVARLEDLADGPQRAVLLEEPLAVFLAENGEPAVVADRCAHRGALLSMGKVCGDSIQCPYHGWEWAGDGSCTRIPSLADQRQIPPLARIPSYPCRVQWGLVWTTLDEPLTDVPDVPWFDPDKWTWGHGTPFELPVAFGLMLENFRDVAHFAFVHQDTLGVQPAEIEPLRPERNGLEVTLRRNMEWGGDASDVWGPLREMGYHTIAPNFTSARMFTDEGERCLLHAARAISATESVHYWIEGGLENFDEEQLEEVIAYDAGIYAEDVAVLSRIEPPELSLDPNAGINCLADRFTLAYRQAFADFVNQALAERSTRAGATAAAG
ncbi:MAG TPA: aromatic ring-hydroxylating dioxygenase subunit alpha [Solirubrobacterales bacterium]|nr:aromatic ring-hydroxylating dioxygenase subunit alpha [Solirubrobacterales bacterium]